MKANARMGRGLAAMFYALGGFLAGFPVSGLGVTTNVDVINFAFSPPAITINVNDQVLWIWTNNAGVPHTSTSDTNGLWDSGSLTSPASFAHTFTVAGSYPYHCTFHVVTFNMKGTITVQGANVAPSVAVTTPANGAVLSAPASFTLGATASDPDGTITNVQFFQETVSLGNATTSPYSVAVSNLGFGDYSFSAVASDNGGLTATNGITVHVVTPVPIVLSSAQRLSPAGFQFNYSANTGLTYVIQRAAALPGFAPIKTNMATNNPMLFQDSSATAAQGFYRVQLQPNP